MEISRMMYFDQRGEPDLDLYLEFVRYLHHCGRGEIRQIFLIIEKLSTNNNELSCGEGCLTGSKPLHIAGSAKTTDGPCGALRSRNDLGLGYVSQTNTVSTPLSLILNPTLVAFVQRDIPTSCRNAG